MRLSKAERAIVLAKYDEHCAYCGVVLGAKWHADHLESVWREPERIDGKYTGATVMARPDNHHIDNMMPACAPCNLSKAAMPLEMWRERLVGHLNSLNSYHPIYKLAKAHGLLIETGAPVVFYFEKVAR